MSCCWPIKACYFSGQAASERPCQCDKHLTSCEPPAPGVGLMAWHCLNTTIMPKTFLLCLSKDMKCIISIIFVCYIRWENIEWVSSIWRSVLRNVFVVTVDNSKQQNWTIGPRLMKTANQDWGNISDNIRSLWPVLYKSQIKYFFLQTHKPCVTSARNDSYPRFPLMENVSLMLPLFCQWLEGSVAFKTLPNDPSSNWPEQACYLLSEHFLDLFPS